MHSYKDFRKALTVTHEEYEMFSAVDNGSIDQERNVQCLVKYVICWTDYFIIKNKCVVVFGKSFTILELIFPYVFTITRNGVPFWFSF